MAGSGPLGALRLQQVAVQLTTGVMAWTESFTSRLIWTVLRVRKSNDGKMMRLEKKLRGIRGTISLITALLLEASYPNSQVNLNNDHWR